MDNTNIKSAVEVLRQEKRDRDERARLAQEQIDLNAELHPTLFQKILKLFGKGSKTLKEELKP